MALQDSLVAVLSAHAFVDAIRMQPPIAIAMLRHLTAQVRFLSDRVVEFNALDRLGILERHTGRLVIRDVSALAGMVQKLTGE